MVALIGAAMAHPDTPVPECPLPDDTRWFEVTDPGTAGVARLAATGLGERIGLPPVRRAELAIVAAEIVTNLYRHAHSGTLLVRSLRLPDRAGVELIAIDRGPGIADLSRALLDGHSSAGGLGVGLGAIARQTSWCDAYSVPGRGTVLVAQVWPEHNGAAGWAHGVDRPLAGEQVNGDAYAARGVAGRGQVMLCDGLGHGTAAAIAARAAVDAFHRATPAGPAEVLRELHRALAHTRGAAVTVVELDWAAGTVRCAGLGNVSAVVVRPEARQPMLAMPGIVGHRSPTIREFRYDLPAGALVVMHSDGVSGRWDLADYPGLFDHSAATVAATILRDAAVRRDDASVLVAGPP